MLRAALKLQKGRSGIKDPRDFRRRTVRSSPGQTSGDQEPKGSDRKKGAEETDGVITKKWGLYPLVGSRKGNDPKGNDCGGEHHRIFFSRGEGRQERGCKALGGPRIK